MCSRDTSYLLALENTSLTPLQHSILERRYINLVNQFAFRCLMLSILYHSTRTIVTVGSLIVPALLSIQYTDATPGASVGSMSYQIYWVTWVISLLVTTCNGIQSIFKIEKKYFFLHTVMEQLRSEGWQFLELSGRYSGFYTPNETPTHENQFIFFCACVEKIKMKQVEEEYWKVNESQQQGVAQAPKDLSGGAVGQRSFEHLIPPTPLKPMTNVVYDHHTPEMHTMVTIQETPEQSPSKSEPLVEHRPQDEPNSQKKENYQSVPVSIILQETTDGGKGNVLLSPKNRLSSQKPSVRF